MSRLSAERAASFRRLLLYCPKRRRYSSELRNALTISARCARQTATVSSRASSPGSVNESSFVSQKSNPPKPKSGSSFGARRR